MPSVKTNAIRVGTFVVVGVIMSVFILIYFGASDLLEHRQTYVTYFDVTVQGLNLDSPVKFRGVTIGKVTDLRIAPDGELIEVEMSLESDFPVTDSLAVKMNITGITGLRYLEIDFPSIRELELSPVITFEPEYPAIPSVPGGIEELGLALKTTYERFTKMDLEGVSFEAKDFFEAGSQVMSHADSVLMTPEFTAWIKDLNLAVGNIEAITTELRAQQMPDRLDSMLEELHLASVEARQGAEHLNNALETLSSDVEQLQLSKRADSLFADISSTFDQTSMLMGQSQYSISQVVAQLSISVTELNSTLQQVNALLLSLEEYPSRVLYSAPPEKEE